MVGRRLLLGLECGRRSERGCEPLDAQSASPASDLRPDGAFVLRAAAALRKAEASFLETFRWKHLVQQQVAGRAARHILTRQKALEGKRQQSDRGSLDIKKWQTISHHVTCFKTLTVTGRDPSDSAPHRVLRSGAAAAAAHRPAAPDVATDGGTHTNT